VLDVINGIKLYLPLETALNESSRRSSLKAGIKSISVLIFSEAT
jgi:hypothetical protein